MSFLSSHRLHWGVHHELTDNFWVQLGQMVRDTTTVSFPQPDRRASLSPDTFIGPRQPTMTHHQEPEALGP